MFYCFSDLLPKTFWYSGFNTVFDLVVFSKLIWGTTFENLYQSWQLEFTNKDLIMIHKSGLHKEFRR